MIWSRYLRQLLWDDTYNLPTRSFAVWIKAFAKATQEIAPTIPTTNHASSNA